MVTGNRNLVGGKGANLAEMVELNIPVPAGFTITTEVCNEFYNNNQQICPPDYANSYKKNLVKVEEAMGAKFGDTNNPLLLSVRSGARFMPGMMDTVLNLGLKMIVLFKV